MTESAHSPELNSSDVFVEHLNVLGNRIRSATAGANEAELSQGESRVTEVGDGEELILAHRRTGPNGSISETLVEWLITKDEAMLYSAVLRWPEQARDVTLTVIDNRVNNDHRSSDLFHILNDNAYNTLSQKLLNKANFALQSVRKRIAND